MDVRMKRKPRLVVELGMECHAIDMLAERIEAKWLGPMIPIGEVTDDGRS